MNPTPVVTLSPHAFRLGGLLVGLAGFGAMSFAQTTPATSSEKADVITLTPFTVTTDKDVGFVGSSSLAGGRMATPLKDTPVAYSVITSEFLDAFNLNDVTQAAAWTVNSSIDVIDNSNKAFAATPAGDLRLRGSSIGTPTRNFFPYVTTPDSYNLDRVDFARGPNAILFGAGGIGGTLNSVTKEAQTNKQFGSIRAQVGSYDKHRLSTDLNMPLLNKKAAVRVNAMGEKSDTWRKYEWVDKSGVSLAATFKATPQLTFRAQGEYGDYREARATTALRDHLSAWDGKTTFSGVTTPALTTAQRAAAGVAGPTSMRWVHQADYPADTLLNFGNLYTTTAAAYNATLANTNTIGTTPIRTVSFNLLDTAMVDDYAGIPSDRWANAERGSPFFTPPSREVTPLWTNHLPTYTERAKDIELFMNYKLGQNLFFEVAMDVNHGDKLGNTSVRRGLMEEYIDINRTLPNGTSNPNFLHPYTEFMEYRNIRNDEEENYRAQMVYSKDTRIGRLNFSVMAGRNKETGMYRALTLLLPLKNARMGSGAGTLYQNLDARTWVDNDQYNQFGVWNRIYLDQTNRTYTDFTGVPLSIFNPATQHNETVTPQWMYDASRPDNNRNALRKYDYYQTAANLDLFHNRLVLIGAFRRDFAMIADKRVLTAGDMPAGWDGSSVAFRPSAPADYFDLTYFPKNSAGVVTGPARPATTRPRARNAQNVNAALPQYANDRFQDDFDSPALHPNVNTFTAGGVLNVTRWFGVYANVSQTFSLTTPQQMADGTLSPPTASQGKDYGIRFNLPGGRLAVSIGGYDSYQAKAPTAVTFNFKNDYNAIADAPVIGDLSPNGRNHENVGDLPDNVYSTVTRRVKGYEIEVTANLTPSWRLLMNAGKVVAKQTDQFPDIIAYFPAHDAIARKMLAASGVIIDPTTNIAKIDPTINPATINTQRVTPAVNAWNDLVGNVIPNTSNQKPQPIIGNPDWVANVATDYRLRTGFLRGVRVGGGFNYRGAMVVGYRGSDTIVDPNDPTKAIDDPTVDASTPVKVPGYIKAVASLSYTIKLPQGRTLDLDFNVDNLFNYRKPVYSVGFGGQSVTYLRARDGNIASPAHVTVPGLFSYVTPRTFAFTAKLNF
jgi:outer membrane receptor protein involved in Fe transport